MMNTMKKVVDSKLIAVGVLILAVIFFGINLFSGSNSAEEGQPDISQNQDTGAVASDNSWETLLVNNFWLIVLFTILAIVAVNWLLKRKVTTVSFSGTLLNPMVAMVALVFLAVAYYGAKDLGIAWATKPAAFWLGLALFVYSFISHSWLIRWSAIVLVAFGIFGPERAEKIVGTANTALDTAADSVTSLVTTGNIKTPAQIAAARRAEVAELKRQQELARIQAEGEARARVAAETAAARELEATMRDARAVPCVRRYTDQLNCFTVTFGYNTKYDREALKGHCIVSDPFDALIRTDLGGNQQRFVGQSGLVAQFFDVPIGVWTVEGKEIRCGV